MSKSDVTSKPQFSNVCTKTVDALDNDSNSLFQPKNTFGRKQKLIPSIDFLCTFKAGFRLLITIVTSWPSLTRCLARMRARVPMVSSAELKNRMCKVFMYPASFYCVWHAISIDIDCSVYVACR